MKEQLRKIVRETMRESVLSEIESINEGARIVLVNPNTNKFVKTIMYSGPNRDADKEVEKLNKKLLSSQKEKGFYWKVSSFESVVTESASNEAMGIAALTGTRKDAVQSFIDKHNLDGVKLLKSMKTANLRGRLNFVTALVGNDGNPNQKLTIKLHQKKSNEEVVNETKFIAFFNNKQHEIDGKDLWDAKQKAITMLKIPKSKVGLLAVVSAESQKRQDFKFN